MLYLTYSEMKAYYYIYVCASHVIYMIILFVQFNSFLEPACKKSCQPIADKLTDIQATKSTAEQPHNLTVPTQPLEAEHSASPSQSPIDIYLRITEPFQQQTLLFPRKHLGNRIAHFKQNGSLIFPGFIIMSKATLWCVSFASNRRVLLNRVTK